MTPWLPEPMPQGWVLVAWLVGLVRRQDQDVATPRRPGRHLAGTQGSNRAGRRSEAIGLYRAL